MEAREKMNLLPCPTDCVWMNCSMLQNSNVAKDTTGYSVVLLSSSDNLFSTNTVLT